MTTRYVGPGGSDAAAGTSWALRKLTLNGVEDTPVAATDIVYVGPGVYRELLTIDVSGSAGNPITYIADVDGSHTDGVGGVVRITGSADDLVTTRASCITATSRNYRTFRGFTFDTASAVLVTLITACGNWIIEDCYFAVQNSSSALLSVAGTGTTNTIRRCVFMGGGGHLILFTHTATVSTSAHLVENCVLIGGVGDGINIVRVGGIAVKNCLIMACENGIRVATALAVGQTTTVNNCFILTCGTAGMSAVTVPATNLEITENYNALWGNFTTRTNVTTGANSATNAIQFEQPILLDDYAMPWNPFALSQWSGFRRATGTSTASDDLFGITRPITASKLSWGPVQFNDLSRETTTKRTGAASIKIADAGTHQIFVPVTNVSTTFSVYVQWEANYAGNKPNMVVIQPGQSGTSIAATGASGTWELLTTTLTPAATPGYVVVRLKSSNSATAGNYGVFFDDFTVT